jgi:alkylation response protein AidB-like acyl-CoA dehydrogenase
MPELYESSDGMRRFRTDLTRWLDENGDTLHPQREGADLAEEVARTRTNQRVLWDAGWLKYGWPGSVGGLGGQPILRAFVAEEMSRRELCLPTVFAIGEVLAPTVIDASPQLASEFVPDFINGTEGWGQGFSEPDAGSDLASLRCRATDEGDHWIVNGEKIWTSYAQFASKILLLARTGPLASRHRGITAMLVDMDSPGVTVQPLHGINGQQEFSATSFDGVHVPKSRLIGQVDGGWAIAMSILHSERGGIFWMLSASLSRSFQSLLSEADTTVADEDALGHAFVSLAGLRARSWTSQHRMTTQSITTPETSVDKILMATAEQELFDTVRGVLNGQLEFSDNASAAAWRQEFMYSRAASIYGGTAEIQRNIVADQVLGLRTSR